MAEVAEVAVAEAEVVASETNTDGRMAGQPYWTRRYFFAALGAIGMTAYTSTAVIALSDNPGLQLAEGAGSPENLAFGGAATGF